MASKQKGLVEFLKQEVGDKLRAVGKYDKDGYDILYIRDDAADQFSQSDIEDIHHEMVLKGLGNQRIESLFNNDNLDCSIYQFDDKIRLHFVHEDYRGTYVSFDFDGEVNPSKIVEECKQIVESSEE
ncbi:MAG: hypothetical protein SV760_05415 [Halobacteria archaeon]|nr:hypothetical protein [Halobacteria archaeon]